MHRTSLWRASVTAAVIVAAGTLPMYSAVGATATTAPGTTVITVHLSKDKITYSGSHTRSAGEFVFKATASAHSHTQNTLVVLSLHKGYSKHQAESDIGAALGANGPADPATVARIDHNITWYGGTQAPGRYSVVLPAGRYFMINEAPGNAEATLTVTGKAGTAAPHASSATVTAISGHNGDRFATKSTLPKGGWVSFTDNTGEPHFMDLQQVRKSVTNAYVRKHIEDPQPPKKVMNFGVGTGPISPGVTISYRLINAAPKGKYLMACFWPSITDGTPHAFMGMWKLVHLA